MTANKTLNNSLKEKLFKRESVKPKHLMDWKENLKPELLNINKIPNDPLKEKLLKREIVRSRHFVDERWRDNLQPELLNIQKESFEKFIDKNSNYRYSLKNVFERAFPITDANGKISIQYQDYILEPPQFSPEECRNRGTTYSSKLILKLKMTVRVSSTTPGTNNVFSQNTKLKDKDTIEVVKEDSYYVGHIPLPTNNYTYVINGKDRFIVSQLKRCSGPLLCKEYIDADKVSTSSIVRVIPDRGSWLEFYGDSKDVIYIKIDRKKKLLFTTFLMCFPDKEGSLNTLYTKQKILRSFYAVTEIEYMADTQTIKIPAIPQLLVSKIFSHHLQNEKGEVIFAAKTLIEKKNPFFKSHQKFLYAPVEIICNFISLQDIFNDKTGEVYLESGDNFSSFFVEFLKKENSNSSYEILCVSDEKEDNLILNTIRQEKSNSRQEALVAWARLMKHSEYAGVVGLNNYFTNSYLSNKLYDMSSIGRRRCIQKFSGGLLPQEEIDEYKNSTITYLMALDIINMVQNLVGMYKKEIAEDDPDSYINRRVRAVGELMAVQISMGLEKITKKLNSKNILTDTSLLNGDFFNAKTIFYPLYEFLNTSPLSQYASQENILSSLRHASKLSVFGGGGISGNTVAPSMRDVNPSQLALVCPVETPEGPHIGLVTNHALAAKIDDDGFLIAPFYVVKNGIITDEKIYLNAFEISQKVMVSKSVFQLNKDKKFQLTTEFLMCRHQNTYRLFKSSQVEITEVSPLQMFSISTGHLTYPENDDGYRTNMAAGMNGQAVVLLHPETPLIGTGMEKYSAMGSGEVVLAEKSGIVRMVDSRIIVVESINDTTNDVPSINLYELKKFGRSNQDTCINQRPIVKIGDIVQKGAILADGYSTYKGELALGRNFHVMYLSNKYGFEDSMKLNKDLVDNEKCASLHVYELEVKAQDTRYGTEEITRDLPDVRGDELANLDENGIIQIGSKVKPGDYLVGKITPEGEKKIDPQKKLLQAMFLNKADTHRKTPLVVPNSVYGTVTRVDIFNKAGVELSGSALVNLQLKLDRKKNTFIHSKNILLKFAREKFYQLVLNEKFSISLGAIKKNTVVNEDLIPLIFNLSLEHIKQLTTTSEKINNKVKILVQGVEEQIRVLEEDYKKKLLELSTEYKFPDDTTLQVVKVYITDVSRTEVGDKIASRYGNKGVISKIEHRIDMPYLEDGRIVDLILNPLGIFARMNLGQLYEVLANIFSEKVRSCVNKFLNQYLRYQNDNSYQELKKAIVDAVGSNKVGHFFIDEKEDLEIHQLTAKETIQLAHKITEGVFSLVPPFESISLEKIQELLEKHQLPKDGKLKAYDGKTSEPLEDYVLAGMQFFMQLVHKVQYKIHARSTGPYLQHTGQPTNGKQRDGGQKLGEMENWANGGHGAAFICKETSIKSDDTKTRKECFIKQCSNNVFSIIPGYTKKEINILNRLSSDDNASSEEHVEPSFALVREELFACGFKMIQKKVIHMENAVASVNEEESMEENSETGNDFLLDVPLNLEEIQEKDIRDKMHVYRDDQIPQYEKIVSFALASPEDILNSSHGEVTTSETINYRTNVPEFGGLLCERIFGPINNYECSCKAYTQKKYYGYTCKKCGVTVLPADARRTRRGHIELACEMFHPFFFRPTNNKMCGLLDISYKDLVSLKSLEKYIVINPGNSNLQYRQIISKEEMEKLSPQAFELGLVMDTGARAVRILLENLDFEKEKISLREKIEKSSSDFKRKHYHQVLSMLYKLKANNIRPEWMILKYIPVQPAGLRQIIELSPNQFASSDANVNYREVIQRNNRLKNLMGLELTDTVIENEMRMLQESVNTLFGSTLSMKGRNKSLADMLQGKGGRFRQNLLGKRVNYSGRSVIVVAPDLKMNECYVPRNMLIVLFKPYMYFLLKKYRIINTWKDAQKILENAHVHNKVWDLLLEAVEYLPYIIANRAPSLHRMSMLSFKIIAWSHKAIGLPPSCCKAFNADFDGDQMALHLPISVEGQLEAEILMALPKNILSPTNGEIIIGPRQDITIGIYALTMAQATEKLLTFYNINEIQQALLFNKVQARQEIKFFDGHTCHRTTVGRVLLWEVMPKHQDITFDVINKPITDKGAHGLLQLVRKHLGDESTVQLAEDIKKLGFEYAEKFGISIGLNDFPKINAVKHLKQEANKKQIEYELQYMDGLITQQDKDKKIYQLWTQVIHSVNEELERLMKQNISNPLFLSIQSGARGSILQLMQIVGLKGFVSHVDGTTSGSVIQGNYMEGLTSQEAFDAQAAARTVGANSSLKTAASGYTTRKLVDVAHAININIQDCGTTEGITVGYTLRNGQIQATMQEQILGRVLAEDIVNPMTGEVVLFRNHFVTEKDTHHIQNIGIVKCKIRSPITCKSRNGICVKCYGEDVSTGEPVVLGEAVGIIAAQSIGEPGSQLTLKSKSFGGVAQHDITATSIISAFEGIIQYTKIRTLNISGNEVVFSRGGKVIIVNEAGGHLIEYIIPYGAVLLKQNNVKVEKGEIIAEWELNQPILSEHNGICKYENVLDKITCDIFFDDTTGKFESIIKGDASNNKNSLIPVLVIYAKNHSDEELARYVLEEHTIIEVEDGEEVSVGTRLGRVQNQVLEKIDIVGGLPKVSAFLENRLPNIPAILAPFSGKVEIKKDTRGKAKIYITNEEDKSEVVEFTPTSKNHRFIVHTGEFVDKGDELTIGTPLLNDILTIKGIDEFFKYFLGGIKKIYEEQGIFIKNIHFEVVASRLLSKVVILNSGDSLEYVAGEVAEYSDVITSNNNLSNPIVFKRIFMGLTATALSTPSLLSAISFQSTTAVLADSITRSNKILKLGFKEELMLGVVPTIGTGFVAKKLINTILFFMNRLSNNSDGEAPSSQGTNDVDAINFYNDIMGEAPVTIENIE